MNFYDALKNMKKGIPMKLPSWGGYWCWDDEKQTIMMHCREKDSDTGKSVLDIRETQRVEYTLSNVCSDEWIPATMENCTLLGGVPTFDFDKAVHYMMRGLKVKRLGTDVNVFIWGDGFSCDVKKEDSTTIYATYAISPEDAKAEDWTFSE